jgi:hypothetical protein
MPKRPFKRQRQSCWARRRIDPNSRKPLDVGNNLPIERVRTHMKSSVSIAIEQTDVEDFGERSERSSGSRCGEAGLLRTYFVAFQGDERPPRPQPQVARLTLLVLQRIGPGIYEYRH